MSLRQTGNITGLCSVFSTGVKWQAGHVNEQTEELNEWVVFLFLFLKRRGMMKSKGKCQLLSVSSIEILALISAGICSVFKWHKNHYRNGDNCLSSGIFFYGLNSTSISNLATPRQMSKRMIHLHVTCSLCTAFSNDSFWGKLTTTSSILKSPQLHRRGDILRLFWFQKSLPEEDRLTTQEPTHGYASTAKAQGVIMVKVGHKCRCQQI